MLDIPSKNRASKTAFLGQTEVLNNMMQKRKRETRTVLIMLYCKPTLSPAFSTGFLLVLVRHAGMGLYGCGTNGKENFMPIRLVLIKPFLSQDLHRFVK